MHSSLLDAERTLERELMRTHMRVHLAAASVLILCLLSAFGHSIAPVSDAPRPSLIAQTSPAQYVTLLPGVSNLSPSPWIIVPTDSTIWVAGIPRNGPANLSQIREFWINGTSRQALNLTNVIFSGMLADPLDPVDKVWFTENSTLASFQLGQPTATKEITLQSQSLEYLSFDSQHRIWMSVIGPLGISNIVMFNPSDRSNQTYQIPSNGAFVQGITIGSDSSVWFAEAGTRKIGHLIPGATPVWSEFSPPSWVSLLAPIQVAQDSHGRIWFTDHGSNQFGFLDPLTNSWNVFPIGYCPNNCIAGLPNSLSVDSNNMVWFSEHIAGRVGRYDPVTNTLTEYNVPLSMFPLMWWAMPGPHNLVWFVAYNLGRIGYVNASLPTPVSLSTSPSSVTIQRGSTRSISVKVNSEGPSNVSFGIEPVSQDQPIQFPPLIYGSSPSNLTLNNNSQTVSFGISTAWNATLGPRYVALTATLGPIEVSVQVLITIIEAGVPFVTLGVSSAIAIGGLVFFLRRPKKPRPSLKRPDLKRC